jgi:hypothetical protein
MPSGAKKTLRPGDRFVTGRCMAAQVSVGDQRIAAMAMRAAPGTQHDAKIEQRPRAWREESCELHAGKLSPPATPLLRRCHKSPVSTRRSHGCSTGSIRSEKPLFKPSLNKEIHSVEHLGLESRRVLSKMAQCQFGKNRPDPSTNGWKFTRNRSAGRPQGGDNRCGEAGSSSAPCGNPTPGSRSGHSQ